MSIVRSMLLAASQNQWLRYHATNYGFVKHSVSRFMPGETLDDALGAAENLRSKKIGTVLTHLGENVKDRAEAQQVTGHYLEVLARFQQKDLPAEISVKLTQLGLDLSPELCLDHLNAIISRAPKRSIARSSANHASASHVGRASMRRAHCGRCSSASSTSASTSRRPRSSSASCRSATRPWWVSAA